MQSEIGAVVQAARETIETPTEENAEELKESYNDYLKALHEAGKESPNCRASRRLGEMLLGNLYGVDGFKPEIAVECAEGIVETLTDKPRNKSRARDARKENVAAARKDAQTPPENLTTMVRRN